MRDASKVIFTVLLGGTLLGAALSRMADPVMQFAAQPDWRARFQTSFAADPLQPVETGPEDLRPYGWTPGFLIAANAAEPEPYVSMPPDHGAAAYAYEAANDRTSDDPNDAASDEAGDPAAPDHAAVAETQTAVSAPPPAPPSADVAGSPVQSL